jgi:hypothetical protein
MRRLLRPRSNDRTDSLTMVREQDRLLFTILRGWDATTPEPDVEGTRTLVRQAYKRGTFGKLLIEHGALRLAAKRDVARVLEDSGQDGLAEEFVRHMAEIRRLLARLDELARGANAMSVAASPEFAGTVGRLVGVLRADLDTEPARLLPGIERALGEHRSELHSARWVRHHAPSHPAPRQSWYARIPLVVRVRTRYDHLRGFPWADSAPMADPAVNDAVEREA